MQRQSALPKAMTTTRHVPWISLSLALNQVLCDVQTAPNRVGIFSSSGNDPRSEERFGSFRGLGAF